MSLENWLWCQVCTFYCPFRNKRYTLLEKKRWTLPESINIHIQRLIYQKYLNLCLLLYYYGKVIFELEKTQARNSTVFIVLVIWPSSTSYFLFVFGFNECLQVFFFLIKLRKCLVFYLDCGCLTLMTLYHFLHPWPWIKNLCAKTTKSIPKCWKRSVKRKCNLNFVRVIKNSSFYDQHFSCSKPWNILWNVLTLSMLVYYIQIAFFWEVSHLCTAWSVQFSNINHGFKCFRA